MKSETKTIKGSIVPSIGLGTWDLRGSQCEKVVELALEIGYRHIDTAKMYDNEENIGNALKRAGISRNELYITTKVWPQDYKKDLFFRSVETSLNKLQLDQVDLLLLHWPKDEATNIKATDYLMQCHEMKYAKHIGVSNFNLPQLKQAQKQAPIFCNQVKYHPYEPKRELLKYMQEQNLLITAYQPLSKGELLSDPGLEETGKAYGKSSIQVALRWLVQQQNVVAIPKASSREHLESNLNVFDFELDEDDMRKFGA
jgi:2,5-diketo-D-gluconate reductase B